MSITRPPAESTEPTCITCLLPLAPTHPHLLIQSYPICHPCFRHLFHLATQSEHSHPASWGGNPLSAPRYAHILGPDLLRDYEAKSAEYAVPVGERVFCKQTDWPRRREECGRFVGRLRVGDGEARGGCVKCEQCKWYTCLRCEETFSTSGSERSDGGKVELEHECDASRKAELEERAFRGLKRGVEWQLCPNTEGCKRRVELREGCNHVVCACGTHFCFVCGERVRDGMGHWRAEGGCPRFGRRGDERAVYDEDVWDDNEVVEDGERARRVQDEEERGEALRRAFEVQMRMVDEVRRDLIRREAERVGGVGEEGGRDASGEGRQRRRRRRRPRDFSGKVDGQAKERHVLRRREHEARRRDTSNDSGEREPRRRRGLRAFLHGAIDATRQVLFGGPPPTCH